MNLEIKNIDTFCLIKGILTAMDNHCSPEFFEEIKVILDEQMKEVPSCDDAGNIIEDGSVEWFQKKFNELCPYDFTETYHPEFIELIDNLREQIGEAMGPMSYAAYRLQEWLRNRPADAAERVHSWKWVWDWVKYYEDNWRF